MKEVKIFDVPVEVFEDLLPETFEYLVAKFKEFVEDEMNSVTVEDYRDWRKYGTIEVILEDGELSYTPIWPKKENPGDDLPWAYDKVEDIEEDVLEEIDEYMV